ncbi:hypothetical protein D2917_11095 [Cupriavidus oxalaticus]|uniref:Uncharacterized protein n=2 Tax=Cupriavidus oxalaticus TaxID=96344 RepID=A0A5P3VED3_9BURK|nr:hypothetical protein D2917_11095 [Cupriavidus oxalaticus]
MSVKLRLAPSTRRAGKEARITSDARFEFNPDGSAQKPQNWPGHFNGRPGLQDCDRGTPDDVLALFKDASTQVALYGMADPPPDMPMLEWEQAAKREARNQRDRERRAQARAERNAAALVPRSTGRKATS